jgi:hypothetical protein
MLLRYNDYRHLDGLDERFDAVDDEGPCSSGARIRM